MRLMPAGGASSLWHLAGPMILSNISVALLGIVDTAVVGHLDQPWYLGGVAIGAMVFDFLYWGMGFLRMGTTGLSAQAHGREAGSEMRTVLGQGLVLAGAIAVLILLLQQPVIDMALRLMQGSVEVGQQARLYFDLRIWGAPGVLAGMVLMGWSLGAHNARIPLLTMLVINVVNILLDLYLVIVLDLGVAGVALASVVAEYSGLLLGVWLVGRELARHAGHWQWPRILDLADLRALLVLNRNIFIRTLCLIFVFAFFTREGARQGDVILAANAVLLNFQALMALGLDGFANALEAMVGRAIGAADCQALRSGIASAGYWSLLTALLYMLLFGLGGEGLIGLMTDIDPVRATATTYLPWMVLSPAIAVWCFMLDGIFIGATRAVEMRNTMMIATFGVYLPGWYLGQPLGNHGLWLAFMLFLAARGVGLGLCYWRIQHRGGFIPVRVVDNVRTGHHSEIGES